MNNDSPKKLNFPKNEGINVDLLNEWIYAHPEGRYRDTASFLSQNITHITQSDFETKLKNTIDKFNTKNKGIPYAVMQPRTVGKRSEWWTYELAKKFDLIPAEFDVHFGNNKIRHLKYDETREYYNELSKSVIESGIKDVLYIDDAVYSGNRIGTNIGCLFRETDCSSINLHILAPYMGEFGKKKLLTIDKKKGYSSNFNSISLYSDGHIQRLKDIINQKNASDDVKYNIDNYMGKSYEALALTYFDHKLPDYVSFLDWVSKGYIFDGKVRKEKYPFIPEIIPPYELF